MGEIKRNGRKSIVLDLWPFLIWGNYSPSVIRKLLISTE